MGYTQGYAQERIHVVVLVDESASFVTKETNHEISIWEKAIPAVTNVINSLHSGDAFSWIRIDEHGHDPTDIRITKIMSKAPLFVYKERKELLEEVLKFKKGSSLKTDIIGALSQAEYVLKSSHGYRGIIMIFSDMEHNYYSSNNKSKTLGEEAQIRNLSFPAGTKSYCFYVPKDKLDKQKQTYTPVFDELNNMWSPVFNRAGLEWYFYPDATRLKGILKNLRQQFKQFK